MATNTCDGCGLTYEVTSDNSKYVIIMADPRYLHVEMLCPNEDCAITERIFITIQTLHRMLPEMPLGIVIAELADQAIVEEYARQYPEPPKDEPPAPRELPTGQWVRTEDLPPIPRDWAISLWDTLREFGGES